jgi:signal transduction histidine kinase
VRSFWSRMGWLTAPIRGPWLLALAYFIGAEAAFAIGTMSDRVFALFWPPNVILFCALMIVPHRYWWRYIAAVFPAHVLAEVGVGMSTRELLAAFGTNCAVALFNAYGVRRFLRGPPWFGDFHKALTYIVVAAGVGPALAAFGGACVPILRGAAPSDYWAFWSHWYAANALPSLTLGPVFLIWFANGARWSTWLPSRRHVKPAILAAALVLTCAFTAEISARAIASSFFPVLLFSPLPFVLWAAVQYGEKGASGAILVVTVIMTWRTLHAQGLFPGEDPARTVLALQLFLTGLSIPVLLLGALIDELRYAARTTRELAASLLRAQDEERRRIARDLHDSTGQHLIAATLIAGRLEQELPPSAQPMLRQLEDMLQQSIREIRTVSYLLHPPLLDEAGLGLALRIYVDGFIERSEVAVELDISPDIKRLSPDTELVLFRLVQEALTNISRHSGSPTARIRLVRRTTEDGHEVVLTIEDAGKGMPDAAGPRVLIGRKANARVIRGVGLASMRERLAQVGGRLEIESVVGRTTLTATLRVRDDGAD